MKATFVLEWDNDFGEKWLNKDNLQYLLDTSSHDAKGKGLIKVQEQRSNIKGSLDVMYLMMVIDSAIKKTTKYFAPKRVMKLTRIGKYDGRSRTQKFMLTTGAPNHAERKFIKDCIEAGEPFPIHNIQVKR